MHPISQFLASNIARLASRETSQNIHKGKRSHPFPLAPSPKRIRIESITSPLAPSGYQPSGNFISGLEFCAATLSSLMLGRSEPLSTRPISNPAMCDMNLICHLCNPAVVGVTVLVVPSSTTLANFCISLHISLSFFLSFPYQSLFFYEDSFIPLDRLSLSLVHVY